MDDLYSVTEHSSADFAQLLDQLIAEAKFNPLYSSKFNAYYEEVAAEKTKNLSLIISKDDNPIIGILCSATNNSFDKREFEYIGRPAALISNPNIDMLTLSEATQVLGKHIASDRSNPFSSSAEEIVGSLRVSGTAILNIRYFQRIISIFNKAQTKFGRVIDLKQNLESINHSYSKSVRSAMKVNLDVLEKIEIVDYRSTKTSASFAFQSLKALHLNSAGRMTRTEESWRIQESLLANGDAFISQFLRDGKILSSAFFMQTKFDAYYGVSASLLRTNGNSLSHRCIVEAIRDCKDRGLNSMHLGDQYSYLSTEISEKERNIEKFKSFFGGDLVLEILFSK